MINIVTHAGCDMSNIDPLDQQSFPSEESVLVTDHEAAQHMHVSFHESADQLHTNVPQTLDFNVCLTDLDVHPCGCGLPLL